MRHDLLSVRLLAGLVKLTVDDIEDAISECSTFRDYYGRLPELFVEIMGTTKIDTDLETFQNEIQIKWLHHPEGRKHIGFMCELSMFPEFDISGWDCSGWDLSYANLFKIEAPGTDFTGCDFRGADVYYANLSNADFQGALLDGAEFEGSDLSYANFTGLDLTVAKFGDTRRFGTIGFDGFVDDYSGKFTKF